MSYFNQNRYSLRQVVLMLTIAFLCISAITYAAVTLPYTFTPGTPISASQVNADFSALANAVNAIPTTPAMIHGNISSTGAIINSSSGFTVTREVPGSGSGYYTIFPTTPFPKLPDCVAQAMLNLANYRTVICEARTVSTSRIDIYCYSLSTLTGNLVINGPWDTNFTFICAD